MCYEAYKDLKLSRQSQVKCEYMRSVEVKFTFSTFQDFTVNRKNHSHIVIFEVLVDFF